MNTDPQQIRAQIEAELADLPRVGPDSEAGGGDFGGTDSGDLQAGDIGADDIDVIDAVGRRLEHAHQILVDALESVEKG